MTEQVGNLGPLDWRIGIVDSKGRPTPEFQRRWEQQRANNGLINSIQTGSGPPTSVPTTDGQAYVDITASPETLYVSSGGTWHKVGAVNFTDLGDVPHDYAGSGTKTVRVNVAEDGLEFHQPAFTDLSDVPHSYATFGGSVVKVKNTEDGLEFVSGFKLFDTGFGFFSDGLLSAGELLGSGVFPETLTFTTGNVDDVTEVLVAPASDAIFPIKSGPGSPTVGHIFIAAGSLTGSSVWTVPFTLPAKQRVSLYAPTITDPQLLSPTGIVIGAR